MQTLAMCLLCETLWYRPPDGTCPSSEQLFNVGVHPLSNSSPDEQVWDIPEPTVTNSSDWHEAKVAVISD